MALSKEAMTDASIRILNRDGIDGLTMRALAQELHVKAASLYNHVDGKQEIYAAVVERMCETFDMPDESLSDKDYLMAVHRGYHKALLSIRDSWTVAEDSPPKTPSRIAIITAIFHRLISLGIDPRNVMTAANMMNNYVLSFTADEARIMNTPNEALAFFSDLLGIDTVPTYDEHDFDAQFDYGLHVLLAGLISVEGALAQA